MYEDSRSFSIAVVVSLVCHLVFFAVFLYARDHSPERRITQSVINVSMVSLPPQGQAVKATLGKQAPPAKAKKAKPAESRIKRTKSTKAEVSAAPNCRPRQASDTARQR